MVDFVSHPANTLPGIHMVYATITDGTRARYLYAPELLLLKPSLQPPVVASVSATNGQAAFNVNGFTGQTIVVHASTDLLTWNPIGTNTLATNTWRFVDGQSTVYPRRFYRAVLAP